MALRSVRPGKARGILLISKAHVDHFTDANLTAREMVCVTFREEQRKCSYRVALRRISTLPPVRVWQPA